MTYPLNYLKDDLVCERIKDMAQNQDIEFES